MGSLADRVWRAGCQRERRIGAERTCRRIPGTGPADGGARPARVQLGLPSDDLHPDSELVNAVVRITGGNFRLIERLMTQVSRLRDINRLDDITTDLVNAARQTLVIGTQ